MGRNSFFISSEAKRISTGPIMPTLNPCGSGAPAIWFSCWKMYICVTDQPGPPHSAGQRGVAQPFLYRVFCQLTVISLVGGFPFLM